MNILLVDHSNTLARALHVHNYAEHEGVFTGAIYGYVQQLSSAIEKHNIHKVIICKDSKPYKRTEIFPDYKINRKPPDAELKSKLKQSYSLAKEFFDISGFPVVEIPGYEADDLIASYKIRLGKDGHKIFIRSTDDDLYQLLDTNTMIVPKSGQSFTVRDFNRKYPFGVENWALYTSMVGGHNNIKGIKGVGPKRATKLLGTENTNGDSDFNFFYMKYEKEIDLYMRLIELPLDGLEVEGLASLQEKEGAFKRTKFLLFLDRLNIETNSYLLDPFNRFTSVGKSLR